ncbi:TetR/AcrR family transcriptional regulator [Burkholderia gladioli]|uniref:TetR/AcrR family transcriptional regulator n=1 Tax=Burkholderia gladioli TaxID=28095 RepID=UPI000694BE32|nr:TetR family transcriptional regulator [Burkholderia gladioli]MBU9274175.1 TetR/AcrR family transcriptional regulator C-terminal domain-containing protein [Burkholderia gladioli]
MAQKETPREPLTRERIAQAALALIDDEGLDGCSMRRLGARLGVEAMAIYHHFKGKGELLDAVMEQLLVGQQLNASLPPLKRLREFMRNQRAVAIAHPRAFILLASRRFNTDFAFALYEQVLAAFAELGLSAKESAFWFRLIGGYVCGAGMAEVASREQVDDATTLLLEHAPERIAYPHVRAIAPHLAVERLEANFELSLDVLFGALAAQVAARQAGD